MHRYLSVFISISLCKMPNRMRPWILFLGSYLYTEASDHSSGTLFQVKSPQLSVHGSGPFKLSFYYHMYGHHIGDLSIYALSYTGSKVFVHGVSGGKKTRKLHLGIEFSIDHKWFKDWMCLH